MSNYKYKGSEKIKKLILSIVLFFTISNAYAEVLDPGFYYGSGDIYIVFTRGNRTCVLRQSNGGFVLSDLEHSDLKDEEGRKFVKPWITKTAKLDYNDSYIKKCLNSKKKYFFAAGRAEHPQEWPSEPRPELDDEI